MKVATAAVRKHPEPGGSPDEYVGRSVSCEVADGNTVRSLGDNKIFTKKNGLRPHANGKLCEQKKCRKTHIASSTAYRDCQVFRARFARL
jgi:hypothetical protein